MVCDPEGQIIRAVYYFYKVDFYFCLRPMLRQWLYTFNLFGIVAQAVNSSEVFIINKLFSSAQIVEDDFSVGYQDSFGFH